MIPVTSSPDEEEVVGLPVAVQRGDGEVGGNRRQPLEQLAVGRIDRARSRPAR